MTTPKDGGLREFEKHCPVCRKMRRRELAKNRRQAKADAMLSARDVHGESK